MQQIVDAILRCENETQFYRIRIAAEDYLTPAELIELADHAPKLPPYARDWLSEARALMVQEIEAVQPYKRLKLDENVLLYRRDPGRRTSPHLLLAFCGAAHRLMAPVAFALQHIDPDEFDVVVLSDPMKFGFAKGIQGFARDMAGLLSRLHHHLDFTAYESVRTLGTSVGAIGALAAAFLIEAERVVAVGGRPLRSYPQIVRDAPIELASFEALFARAGELSTRVIITYGADCVVDRDGGIELADRLQGEEVPLPGIESHACLHEVLKQGWLARYFRDVLSG